MRTKFGVDSSSRFPFRGADTNKQTLLIALSYASATLACNNDTQQRCCWCLVCGSADFYRLSLDNRST